MDAMLAEFERTGFIRLPDFCPAAKVEALLGAVDEFVSAHGGNSRAGARDILRECPAVAAWAGSRSVRVLTARLLGGEAFVGRGIFLVRLHLDDCPAENGALESV